MDRFWLGALVAVNGLTFLVWGWDKWRSTRGGRRVPEAWLLGLALATGFVGAWLGVRVFRHKTRKRGFRIKLVLVTLVSLAALVGLVFHGHFIAS